MNWTTVLFSVVTSFSVSLQYRRDSSFYLCGEVSRFLSLLCSRIYTPDTAPLANAWFLLLRFQTSEATFLSGDEYLVRLKLASKVSAACKARAEGLHFGKKSERAAIQATAETVKADFVKDSQHYIQFVINGIHQRTGLSTNLVKGLAAFDPFIMLKRPMDVALRHFDISRCCTAASQSDLGSMIQMSPSVGINIFSCWITSEPPTDLISISPVRPPI